MNEVSSAAVEFSAIQKVHNELAPLAPDARKRVLDYLINLLDVDVTGRPSGAHSKRFEGREDPDASEDNPVPKEAYGSFAELFDGANPNTNADKALVAGYWLQVHDGVDGFDSQSANSLLKNLGHGLPNVTAALSALKELKPALVLQLKKSGTSQQARKTYKVTVAGIKAVKDMIGTGEQS